VNEQKYECVNCRKVVLSVDIEASRRKLEKTKKTDGEGFGGVNDIYFSDKDPDIYTPQQEEKQKKQEKKDPQNDLNEKKNKTAPWIYIEDLFSKNTPVESEPLKGAGSSPRPQLIWNMANPKLFDNKFNHKNLFKPEILIPSEQIRPQDQRAFDKLNDVTRNL
jgi:hypothetical protein